MSTEYYQSIIDELKADLRAETSSAGKIRRIDYFLETHQIIPDIIKFLIFHAAGFSDDPSKEAHIRQEIENAGLVNYYQENKQKFFPKGQVNGASPVIILDKIVKERDYWLVKSETTRELDRITTAAPIQGETPAEILDNLAERLGIDQIVFNTLISKAVTHKYVEVKERELFIVDEHPEMFLAGIVYVLGNKIEYDDNKTLFDCFRKGDGEWDPREYTKMKSLFRKGGDKLIKDRDKLLKIFKM